MIGVAEIRLGSQLQAMKRGRINARQEGRGLLWRAQASAHRQSHVCTSHGSCVGGLWRCDLRGRRGVLRYPNPERPIAAELYRTGGP